MRSSYDVIPQILSLSSYDKCFKLVGIFEARFELSLKYLYHPDDKDSKQKMQTLDEF